jgi:hypothetical protein
MMNELNALGVDPRKAAAYNAMLAAGRDDFIYFWTEILGMPIHDGQREFVRESLRQDENHNFLYKTVILSPSNQWGKDVICVGICLWDAFYKERLYGYPAESKFTAEYPIAYLSPHSNQLDRAYKYATQIIAGEFVWEKDGALEGPNKSKITWAISRKSETPYYVRFFNGAEMFFRPTGEDQSASASASPYARIIYTEACRSYHLETEYSGVLLPRSTRYRSQIIMPSTPWFESPSFQFFADLFDRGQITDEHPERDPGFFSMGGSLYDNTFLPHEEKEKIEAMSDPEIREQTIYGKFIRHYNTYFDTGIIKMLFSNKLIGFEARDPMSEYIVAWDTAFGRDDKSVFGVFKRLPQENAPEKFQLVRREAFFGNTLSPESQYGIANSLVSEYNKAALVVDGSGPQGLLIKSKLEHLNPVMIDFAHQKDAILPVLKDFLSSGRRTVRDAGGKLTDTVADFGRLRSPYIGEVAKELASYPGPDADKRSKCDHVAMLGLLAYYVEKVTKPMEVIDIDILQQEHYGGIQDASGEIAPRKSHHFSQGIGSS